MARTPIALALIALLATPALAASKKQPTGADAPAPPSQVAQDTVWVGKPDNAKSCGEQKGIDIDLMAGELQKAEVQIHGKKKLPDGKVRIQMCGADKGDMNGFLISKKDLEKAKGLGFRPVTGPY